MCVCVTWSVEFNGDSGATEVVPSTTSKAVGRGTLLGHAPGGSALDPTIGVRQRYSLVTERLFYITSCTVDRVQSTPLFIQRPD